jgi:hypothetical protein
VFTAISVLNAFFERHVFQIILIEDLLPIIKKQNLNRKDVIFFIQKFIVLFFFGWGFALKVDKIN